MSGAAWDQHAGWWQQHFTDGADPEYEEQILPLMDEYLTGERDKPVRYTWRLPAPDRRVLEVHDLAIGETDTKVVEVEYARRK